jgi:hypothetical protein
MIENNQIKAEKNKALLLFSLLVSALTVKAVAIYNFPGALPGHPLNRSPIIWHNAVSGVLDRHSS